MHAAVDAQDRCDLSSTSMVPSGIELLTSTGTLSSVRVGAVVPAPTRDTLRVGRPA